MKSAAIRLLLFIALFPAIAQGFYDPGQGRWCSRDPIEESGGPNLYAFVENDGTDAIDPLGREAIRGTGRAVDESYTWKQTYPGTNKEPRTPTGKTKFDLEFDITREAGCVMNVIIRIDFRSGASPEAFFKYFPGYRAVDEAGIAALVPAFQQGVAKAWNDKFQLCCDSIRGTYGSGKSATLSAAKSPDLCCCAIRVTLVPDKRGTPVGVYSANARSSGQDNWNQTEPGFTPGQVAAHEVGHFLGNIDEYGKAEDPHLVGNPRVPYGQALPEPRDPNVMAGDAGDVEAKERHFWRVLKAANATPGLSGCTLKKIAGGGPP